MRTLTAAQVKVKQKEILAAHKAQLWRSFLVPAAQIPVWIGVSMSLRQLCGVQGFALSPSLPAQVDALRTDGLLWFTDLTAIDTTAILPATVTALYLINVEVRLSLSCSAH